MSISIKLTDSINFVQKNINVAIAEYVNSTLKNNKAALLSNIQALIPEWIRNQPEIISLASSDASSLVGQFGIVGNTQSIIEAIISSVVNSTTIQLTDYNASLGSGGLELQFQPSNFSNLLSLSVGHTIYEGGDLHWLDWLLTRGDNVIVTNYHYNPVSGFGRSKLGNMTGGGSFRVPPQFSGTKDNNFITRAFSGDAQEKQLTNILDKILG